MEKNFIRVRSIKDITISSSLLLIGIILSIVFDSNGAVYGGVALIILSLILLFVLKSGYKDTESGEFYKKRDFSFNKKMKASLLSALASSPENINPTDEGEGIRLEIFYSKTSGKAFLQLFEYVPFQYHPCSEVYEYEIDRIKNFVK